MGCGTSTAAGHVSPEQLRVLQLERELEWERAKRLEQEVAQLRVKEQAPSAEDKSPAESPVHTRVRTHRRSSSSSSDSAPSKPAPNQDVAAAKPAPPEPAQAQEPVANEPTPFWTQERKKLFKGVVQGGVRAIWALCQEYKSVLPFPGGPGVALIGQIAELVGTALANKDNLESLLHRAMELMDIIIEKHVSQEELSANVERKGSNPKPGSRKYCNLMEQLHDLLQEILEYTRNYCDRNFILKLLMTSYDRDQHSELADRLARLMVDAHFSVSVDTHTMTVEVHAISTEMREMLTSVRSAMPYVDHSSEVKRMVESLGGMDAVLKSEAKVEQVAKHLDHGQQITIAMLNQQVQAALLAAMSKNDTGVHTIIRNTDMRTFWRQFFNGLTKVEWDVWWCAFPSRLHEVVKDKQVVEQVMARLSSESEMAQFRAFVERSDPETLSVREIELAFPLDASILEVVERAVGLGQEDSTTAVSAQSQSDSAQQQPHSQVDDAPQKPPQLLRQPSLVKGTRCLLPQLGKEYTGRGKDAAAVEELVKQQSSKSKSHTAAVCIVAGAGFGKSTLSIDVGWRLSQAGLCPGGAVMVDMREAGSFEAALGRICGVLEVTMDEHAAESIFTHLAACHQKHGGPLLLVLDNAEDPAGGTGGAQFGDYVAKVAQHAILLITSRTPVAPDQSIRQHCLGSLEAYAARSLLQAVAPNLEQHEAEEAADMCGGVPLLLRHVGHALQRGQIVLEDLKAATADADPSSAILNLTLCTLPRQQQLQLAKLSVFPSGFKEDGAAAVLGVDEARASGLLAVLCRHGLVTRDFSTGTSSLHAAVRSAAAGIGGAGVRQKGQERFVVHVLDQLGQWARMFYSKAWELPLSLAREAGADILAAFELAGKLTSEPGSLPERLLTALLAMEAAQVQELLSYAGHRKGTWSLLQHLYKRLQSEGSRSKEQLAAAAFFCFLAVRMDESSKDHWDTACAAASQAHQLYAACYMADHPRVLACIHALGECCKGQIKYTEAEVLFRQAYEARLRTQGAQVPGTLEALFGLAECLYYSQSLPDKAEPLYRDLHTQLLDLLGPLHPLSSRAGDGLAGCMGDLGKLSGAEALCRETLDARKHVLGHSHPSTLDSMNNLASCLVDQGNLSGAEALYRETLDARKRVLGHSHPSTLASMNYLANCLVDQGKLSGAEALYRETLDARKHVLGHSHPSTLTSMNDLAVCLENQGKLSEAEALLRDAVEVCERVLGGNHPKTLMCKDNLNDCLRKEGKEA